VLCASRWLGLLIYMETPERSPNKRACTTSQSAGWFCRDTRWPCPGLCGSGLLVGDLRGLVWYWLPRRRQSAAGTMSRRPQESVPVAAADLPDTSGSAQQRLCVWLLTGSNAIRRERAVTCPQMWALLQGWRARPSPYPFTKWFLDLFRSQDDLGAFVNGPFVRASEPFLGHADEQGSGRVFWIRDLASLAAMKLNDDTADFAV